MQQTTGRYARFKQTNLQLQFLPSVGSFLPLLPLHPPRPLSSAPPVRTNTPPLTLIGSGRVMWYIVPLKTRIGIPSKRP